MNRSVSHKTCFSEKGSETMETNTSAVHDLSSRLPSKCLSSHVPDIHSPSSYSPIIFMLSHSLFPYCLSIISAPDYLFLFSSCKVFPGLLFSLHLPIPFGCSQPKSGLSASFSKIGKFAHVYKHCAMLPDIEHQTILYHGDKIVCIRLFMT